MMTPKYKIIEIKHYQKLVNMFLEENVVDAFESEIAQEMIFQKASQFAELLKPMLIQEFQSELNNDPDAFDDFEYIGDGWYQSNNESQIQIKIRQRGEK